MPTHQKDNPNVVANDDAAVNAQNVKNIENAIDHGTSPEEYDRIAERANAARTDKPGSQSNSSDQHNNGRGGGK